MTHNYSLPRRTAATTRFSPEKVGCQKRRRHVLLTVRSVGPYLASTHQMAPPKRGRTHLMSALLLIYRPRKDERLSWPAWLACSGRFTHIVVTRRLQAERRTGSVRRPKTGVLPTNLFSSNRDGWFQQDGARADKAKTQSPGWKTTFHYIPKKIGLQIRQICDLSPIENVWSIMAAAVYASLELQTLTPLERPQRKSRRSIYFATVQNLIGSMPDRQSSETKESLFRTDTCALSWPNVVCRSVILQFLGVATYCCWAALCIIFSSNNFVDRMAQSLSMYEVYNVQLFAFEIVHDDVCHVIFLST